MGVDDLFSTESAVVAAATAAVCSPRTRETMRRGVVLGVAGAMKVGDVVAGAARGASRGIRGQERAEAPAAAGNGAETPTHARRSTAARTRRSGTGTGAGAGGS